jgi:hypothetical protein
MWPNQSIINQPSIILRWLVAIIEIHDRLIEFMIGARIGKIRSIKHGDMK